MKFAARTTEVIVILLLGFGLFIFSSLNAVSHPGVQTDTIVYSNADFYVLVIYELLVLTIVFVYFRSRGWSPRDFNLCFTPSMIGVAMLLVLLRKLLGFALTQTGIIAGLLEANMAKEPVYEVSIPAIVLVLIVNSFYEELLLIGYFFKRLGQYPALAVFISLIIRVTYHLYQGWYNVPMMIAMGLVFGLYYAKYRKLWPLIMAHAAGNLFSILSRQYGWPGA